MTKKKKVLVTGSGGFIFSNFIRRAFRTKQPLNISSLDRVREGQEYNVYLNSDHHFYICDIRDPHVLNVVFKTESPDIVVHGAAESFVDSSINDAQPFVTTNIVGTQNIIDACLRWGVKKLIYISTDEVYGHLTSENDPAWTEEATINPRNPYCLPSDTLVLLENGNWKQISKIEPGESVIGVDFSSNKLIKTTVSEVHKKSGTKSLAEINTEFGTLRCSPDHTVFVKRLKRWKSGKIDYKFFGSEKIQELPAKNIVDGDFLGVARKLPEPAVANYVSPEDNVVWVRVNSVNYIGNQENLYDLTVPTTQNFVINGGFIVHNSASKASGELLVKAAHQTHGLTYNITRCCNNYGPWQHREKMLPKIIKSVLRGNKMPIYGQGLQVRDWLHVHDNCDALYTIINDGYDNETYNISAGFELTNIELFQKVCNLIEEQGGPRGHELIEFVKDRPGHDFRYSVDSGKLRALGWKPKLKLNDGLNQTISWYISNQFCLKED